MPTLRETDARTVLPGTIGTLNRAVAAADAAQIIAAISPAASTGNSVLDFLEDLIARTGHVGTATTAYDNSASYAIGDEVYWIDGSSRKRFFKRLTAGGDGGAGTPLTHASDWDEIGVSLHNTAVEGDDQGTLDAVLVRHPTTQQIIFTTAVQAELNRIAGDYQDAAAVQALIDITAGRLADTARWRGAYANDITYSQHEYATFSGTVYRRTARVAAADGSGDPTDHPNSWTAVSGIERLIAFRLRDIEALNTYAVEVPAAQANRGRWLARQRAAEGYGYVLPPMQWRGAWSAGGTNYYGDVVSHNRRTWVLTNADTATTGKTGANSEPGRDADWVEIPTGHTDDIARYRGEWDGLGGQTIRVGDIVSWLDDWYICHREHVSSSSIGPDDDDTYLILNNFHPQGWSNRFYHAGTTLVHGEQVWFADEQVVRGDPEPGATGNHKWRQITGATQADLDALRREVHDLALGASTTRATYVASLPTPIEDSTPTPVWLPALASTRYTAPAAQTSRSEDYAFDLPHEPGEYEATTGTVNRMGGHVGAFSAGGHFWRGIFTRAHEGAPWDENAGGVSHDALGSAIMGVGIQDLGGDEARAHLVVKETLYEAWDTSGNFGGVWIRVWDRNGTEQNPVAVGPNNAFPGLTHGGVRYRHLVGTLAGANPFNAIIAGGTGPTDRLATIGISATRTSGPLYLGNATRGWTRIPPDLTRDESPVYSGDIHNIRFMTQAAFEALDTLEPRTLYLTERPST
ncbi:MAG: hypothetical protein F4Y02_11230 [Chloroflexi bacterium]|nr:hypothetical protein [Chloroflexota bacterium]